MKNSKLRRVLLLLASAVLLVSLSVGATLAYLQSQTAPVINTFSVGDVEIKLDEAPVDSEGKKVEGNRVAANTYHILPGQTYDKDPMVTVLADSESSYIRMLVTVSDIADLMAAIPEFVHKDAEGNDYFNLAALVTGWDSTKWAFEGITGGNVYEFRYYTTVSTEDAAELPLEPLFTNVVIPGFLTNAEIDMLDEMEISIIAQAIQSAGFGSADEAWAQWVVINNTTTDDTTDDTTGA